MRQPSRKATRELQNNGRQERRPDMAVVLHAPPIHDAVAKGDADQRRRFLGEAKQYVAERDNVPPALGLLKAELTRAETPRRVRLPGVAAPF